MNEEHCETDVYEQGTAVAISIAPREEVQAASQELTDAGEKTDWYYAAGRSVIKTLGDVEKVADYLKTLGWGRKLLLPS